jgi:hypothetical protein
MQAIKVLNMIKLYGKPIRVNKVCFLSSNCFTAFLCFVLHTIYEALLYLERFIGHYVLMFCICSMRFDELLRCDFFFIFFQESQDKKESGCGSKPFHWEH